MTEISIDSTGMAHITSTMEVRVVGDFSVPEFLIGVPDRLLYTEVLHRILEDRDQCGIWSREEWLDNLEQMFKSLRSMIVDIPADPVSPRSGFVMNPETETTLSGKDLREGMVVILAEDSLLVRDPSSEYADQNVRARVVNRWCRITKLECSGNIIGFVGVYADKTEIPRSYNSSYYWYVKKNSR